MKDLIVSAAEFQTGVCFDFPQFFCLSLHPVNVTRKVLMRVVWRQTSKLVGS